MFFRKDTYKYRGIAHHKDPELKVRNKVFLIFFYKFVVIMIMIEINNVKLKEIKNSVDLK